MSKFVCPGCEHVFDDDLGDPASGWPPGTPPNRLGPAWRCPQCGVHGQEDLLALEEYDASNDLDS